MNAPPIRGSYSLTDHHGHPVTEQTYAGRWQLVQFGFTSCTMICPRALAKLSGALDELERAAGPVPLVPLYITVDPERDSPAVMRAYLKASCPRFTGLTGTEQQVEAAKQSFKIFTRRRDTPEGYQVQHTAITYLLDPAARPARYWPDTESSSSIAADLSLLLARE